MPFPLLINLVMIKMIVMMVVTMIEIIVMTVVMMIEMICYHDDGKTCNIVYPSNI